MHGALLIAGLLDQAMRSRGSRHIGGRLRKNPRRGAFVVDLRRQRRGLDLGVGCRCGWAGQHVARRLADDDMARRRCEDRHQADFGLPSPDIVPTDPYAVRSAKFRGAVVRGELLRRERELLVRFDVLLVGGRVVVAVDDQLTFDRHRLIGGVVEVDPAAKASLGFAHVRAVLDRRSPEHDHARRRLVLRLLQPVLVASDRPIVPGRHLRHCASGAN